MFPCILDIYIIEVGLGSIALMKKRVCETTRDHIQVQQTAVWDQVLETATTADCCSFYFKGFHFSSQLCKTIAAFHMSGEAEPFEVKAAANNCVAHTWFDNSLRIMGVANYLEVNELSSSGFTNGEQGTRVQNQRLGEGFAQMSASIFQAAYGFQCQLLF